MVVVLLLSAADDCNYYDQGTVTECSASVASQASQVVEGYSACS